MKRCLNLIFDISRCFSGVRYFLAVLLFFGTLPTAHAQNFTWTGNASTNWNNALNWDPATIPTTSNIVIINAATGNQAVITSASASADTVFVGFDAASSANTSLRIENGRTLTSAAGRIGYETGSSGFVVVDGAGSKWNATAPFVEIYVGVSGNGSLTISNGGTVTSVRDGYVGKNSGAVGTLLITGPNSTWNSTGAALFTVGSTNGGLGNVVIANGGKLDFGSARLSLLNGTIVVDGAGSSAFFNGDMQIGNNGNGTLLISNGGYVNALLFSTGDGLGASGYANVTVTGANSLLDGEGSVNLPLKLASGVINIADGGTIDIGFRGMLAIEGNGTLNLADGGTLKIGGANGLQSSGAINFAGGTLQIIPVLLGNDFSSSANISLATSTSSTLNTGSFNTSLTGVLSGAGSLIKAGNGTLTLSGANTYMGLTTVSNGTLVLSGSLAGLGGNIVDNAALVFDQAADQTYGGTISGNGTLTKLNAGRLTLEGANSYTGNTTITAGTLAVNGTGAAINGTNMMRLADSSNAVATLTISNSGSVTSGQGDIAGGFDSIGMVTVTGANSTWSTGASDLYIGGFGTASLTIANGGAVSAASVQIAGFGTGSVLVTGPNSTLTASGGLNPGFGGTGNLTISNGGSVTSSYASLAFAPDSNATVLVSGAGSTWNYGTSMDVGGSGNGTLTIADGGKTAGGTITLATGANITGTLNINTQGVLEVGGTDGIRAGAGNYAFNWGGGTIKLTSDLTTSLSAQFVPDAMASVLNTNGFNATWSGVISGSDSFAKIGNGTLTFTGNNTYSGLTTVASGNLQVGAGGNSGALGTSRVDNSGNLVFNRANDYAYAGNISGSGNLYQEGAGTLILSGNNTYTGETRINGGTLQLTDVGAGSVLGTSTVFVTENGTLTGSGIIGGNVVVAGLINPGVGNTTDLIFVAGGLVFNPGSVITVDLNGSARGVEYDAFDVGLNILYGGTLNVLIGGGYTPFKGYYYDLFNVGGSGAGAFTVLNLPVLPGALEWDTSSLYTNGRLLVVPEPGVSAALAGFAALGLCLWRRARK